VTWWSVLSDVSSATALSFDSIMNCVDFYVGCPVFIAESEVGFQTVDGTMTISCELENYCGEGDNFELQACFV
jgi:hypothetical protein